MISVQQTPDGNALYLDFPAQVENIEHMCARAKEFLVSKNITTESFAILLVVREMVNNAVIHGSQLNPHMQVRVVLTLDEHGVLHIQIQDQGNGFDWQSRLQSEVPDSEGCSGRGIRIVQCYADACTYNPSGNIVQIQKKVFVNDQ